MHLSHENIGDFRNVFLFSNDNGRRFNFIDIFFALPLIAAGNVWKRGDRRQRIQRAELIQGQKVFVSITGGIGGMSWTWGSCTPFPVVLNRRRRRWETLVTLAFLQGSIVNHSWQIMVACNFFQPSICDSGHGAATVFVDIAPATATKVLHVGLGRVG